MPTAFVTEGVLPEMTRARLCRALLLKSFLEVLIICAVLSVAGFAYLNPTIRGAITQADATSVHGWVFNPLQPGEPSELQLFVDGHFTSALPPSALRREVAPAGGRRDSFVFSFRRLPPGTHSVEVYVVQGKSERALTLVGITRRPESFQVNP